MDKKKIDKTKERIGVSRLQEDDRKKLFNKFVDAGGKVVDEKEMRKNLVIDREKQRNLKKKIEEQRLQRDKDDGAGRKTAVRKGAASRSRSSRGSGLSGFFQRMKIRFKLKFLGVTSFGGGTFDRKFLERIQSTYKPALLEIQMVFFDIYRSDPPTGRKVTEALDKIRPLYFEVAEMIGRIYDDMTFKQILDHYRSFPDVPYNSWELKEQLMGIFRSLYVLKIYENTILNSFEKSLSLRLKIDKDKASTYSTQRKRVKNSLYDIFHRFFPRLYWLFCYYEGAFYEMNDLAIEDILSITSDDKPGRRVISLKKKDEQGETDDGGEANEEEGAGEDAAIDENLEDHIKRGLDIIYSLDYNWMRGEYDKPDQFKILSIRDKVLLTYLIFSEFDREYSCILTTSKIKYKRDMDVKGVRDYKSIMQNFYDQMRKCFDSFKDYSEVSSNFLKASEDKPISNSQHLQYSKRLNDIQKKRSQIAQSTRETIRHFMENLGNELKFLMVDMGSLKKFVDNPDDVLEFTPQIEGIKKVNGKTIRDAITTVYYFVSAFAYRLSVDGDLSGDLELGVDELLNRPRMIAEETPAKKKDAGQDSKKGGDKSILDELDDIL